MSCVIPDVGYDYPDINHMSQVFSSVFGRFVSNKERFQEKGVVL